MGSMCSCNGSRLSNSVFPTNMTSPYKLRNSDLALYRRYRKKDDVDNGKVSRKAKTSSKGEPENAMKKDVENDMLRWKSSIALYNHVLPRTMTFDRKRHLSMRGKYTKIAQVMNLKGIIYEKKDDKHKAEVPPFQSIIKRLKAVPKKKIKKSRSSEMRSKGLGPVSTRISDDAVKKNWVEKNRKIKLKETKIHPPSHVNVPKTKCSHGIVSKPTGIEESKESMKLSRSGKSSIVSTVWIDEDFENDVLCYTKEKVEPGQIEPRNYYLPSVRPLIKEKKQRTVSTKIDPAISDPAVYNLGVFLSAAKEDTSELEHTSWFWQRQNHEIECNIDIPLYEEDAF